MKNLRAFLFLLFVAQGLFSCSSREYFTFTGTNPEALSKVKPKVAPAAVAQAAPEAVLPVEAVKPGTAPAPVMTADAGPVAPIKAPRKASTKTESPVVASAIAQPVAPVVTGQQLSEAREKIASMSKSERKALKKDLRQVIGSGLQADTNMVLLIILAILIPPLAVGLKEGITSRFWISLLLTLLFFIPGMIYALLVVTDTI
ncbi:MAG: YqaE/Pmp3 family membrane protein [Adhaeribacter sp.]